MEEATSHLIKRPRKMERLGCERACVPGQACLAARIWAELAQPGCPRGRMLIIYKTCRARVHTTYVAY